MNTSWLPIPIEPFCRYYEVSDVGEVRRIPSTSPACRRQLNGRALKPVMQKNYYVVNLRCEGQSKTMKIHHLVAFAFIGRPPGSIGLKGYTINHKNFDKLDNRASNLEWLTAADNRKHAQDAGRFARGEKHGISKLTDNKVRLIRTMRAGGKTYPEIAMAIGDITKTAVRAVLTGKTWTHVA